MLETQKLSTHVKATAFLDFIPAELHINSQWLVVYRAKNPITNKMERHRLSVPVIKSNTERRKLGVKMVLEINKKLASGWLPFYSSSSANEFKTYVFCFEQFLKQTEDEIKTGAKRSNTLKSYTSYFNILNTYIKTKKQPLNLVLEFNQSYLVNYLDWLYFERKNSPRTYNNHLNFFNVFVNYCISRGYLKENFVVGITRKKNQSKIRQVFDLDTKQKVKSLAVENEKYYALCMMTYFCFLRRTEIVTLKVGSINLIENYITIEGENSKNKKTENITIPAAYKNILSKHIEKSKPNDFVFSANNFGTGEKELPTKKISDTWAKFRKEKNVPTKFQFYSLKDSGITDLLKSGIAAIKVRDQARHHDLKITESYTARNIKCDDVLRNSNFDF